MKTGRAFLLMLLIVTFTQALPAQIPDFTPPTPLIGALLHNEADQVRKLLQEGANPNEPAFVGFPPLFLPIMHRNLQMLKDMVAHGAKLDVRDMSGSTALMWAAASEVDDPAIVEELLRLGLDPAARNNAGETAAAWALKRGHTSILNVLRKAGPASDGAIRDSAQRALDALQKTGPEFLKVSNCVSCHHQFLPLMAGGLARDRGLHVDEKVSALQADATIELFKPLRDDVARATARIPDPSVTVSYALIALGAERHPADRTTAALAQVVANTQFEDGGFRTFGARPPIESSVFTATALSIRALQLYGNDVEGRVARAGAWLRSATPRTMEDRTMQLLGLVWSKAETEQVRKRAAELLAEQRPDGGWAQLPALETDAYATGQALVALNSAGVPASDEHYQRGIDFLLRTQFADGSWLVRTRSFPFQRYKESGFPHGKDQWISAAGTSWAVMALSLALPPSNEQAQLSLPKGGTQWFEAR